MGSTGPLFLSVIWRHYNNEGHDSDDERIRLLFPDEYNKNSWSFFSHHVGSSWHRADVKLILWMAQHWVLLTIMGFICAGLAFVSLWYLYGRFVSRSGSAKGPALRRRMPLWFWRRRAGSGTAKLGENAVPLLERRNSDMEDRRVE
jgi:hypothetical protein